MGFEVLERLILRRWCIVSRRPGGPTFAPKRTRYRFAARVRAAFFADAVLSAGVRLRAAALACCESALFEAAALPSRLSALSVACERLRDLGAGLPLFAFRVSRNALVLVSSETLPRFGGGSFTPARRALERPIAIACFAERAPWAP